MTRETAILFPGQGSQSSLMGKELAERKQEAMELWKKAEKYSSLPLREIYWESKDEQLMANTLNLQPALTVVNLALWLDYASRVTPLAFAGHSLGEYSALAASKVLTFDDTLKLVSLRGKLMSEADPNNEGGMYVVLRLALDEIEPTLEEINKESDRIVRIANYNTPKQFAISGHKDAIEKLIDKLKPQKAKAMPLAVSGAFHTPLMAGVNSEFSKMLDKVDWNSPIAPIYANVTAEKVTTPAEIHPLMKRQMTSSVLWSQIITKMYTDKIRSFTEVGPKGVLIRMVPHIIDIENVETGHYE